MLESIEGPLFQTLLSILAGIVVALLSGYLASVRERQWWLKEEVYRPIYNELENVAEGRIPSGRGTWAAMDSYQKYRVDSSLKAELEKYTDILRRVSNLSVRVKDIDELMDTLPEEMKHKDGQENWQIKFGGTRHHPYALIDDYGDLALTTDKPEEFRQAVYERPAGQTTVFNSSFEKWDEEVPEWHVHLWEVLRNNEYGLERKAEEYGRLRNEVLPEIAEEIHDELEKQINESIFVSLFRWRV